MVVSISFDISGDDIKRFFGDISESLPDAMERVGARVGDELLENLRSFAPFWKGDFV